MSDQPLGENEAGDGMLEETKSREEIRWEVKVSQKQKENPAFRSIETDLSLPNVLLIGDSISIGYTEPVRNLLSGKANVYRIPENGGPTSRGVANLDKWLGDRKWDLIHFNWGLHDLKYMKDGKLDLSGTELSTVEQYAENLEELVARLKNTRAKLIWASTTPVPEGAGGRRKGDRLSWPGEIRRARSLATRLTRS